MNTALARRALPGAAVVLLGAAVLLLWIGVLLMLLALLFFGPGSLTATSLFSLPGGLGDSLMANAVLFQWAVTALSFLVFWILGSLIVFLHLSGRLERAADLTIWLVRVFMVFIVVGPLVALGPIFSISGFGAQAFLALLPQLPQMLVSLAFLVCAEAYLRRGLDSIF